MKNGHHSTVEVLVNHGANVNVKDNFGLTPLMYLARNGYINMLTKLIRLKKSNSTAVSSLLKSKSLEVGISSILPPFEGQTVKYDFSFGLN